MLEYGLDGLYGVSGRELRGVVELEVAVDLVGGDVVQALVVAADRLEHLVGADQVGLHERPRRVQRVVVVGLGGEVHDGVAAGHGGVDRLLVADVGLRQRHALEALDVAAVAGVGQQVVDDDLPVGPLAVDVADEVRADEAGAAGDQQLHDADPCLEVCGRGRRASPAGRGARRRSERSTL